MKTILLTIIGVLCVTVGVLAYNLYQCAHQVPPTPEGSGVKTAADPTDILLPYEQGYEARTKASFQAGKVAGNPLWGGIISGNVLSDIKNYTTDKGKDPGALRSVWVDDTTLLHFAYYLLQNKSGSTPMDGIRLVVEEYQKDVTLPCGTACPKGTLNLALVATQRDATGHHVNWFSDKLFDPGKPFVTGQDAPPYDNYNDPCPASQTNCLN